VCGRSPAEDLLHTFAPRSFTPSYRAKKRLCTVKKARKALLNAFCALPFLCRFRLFSLCIIVRMHKIGKGICAHSTFYPVALHRQNKTVVQGAQLQVKEAYNLYNFLGFFQCFAGVFCRFGEIFPQK